MTEHFDLGTFFAETAKAVVLASFDDIGLTRPGLVMTTAGTGIPIADGCEGMLWVRVDTVFPTNGDGNPLQATRIDFDLPAWTFPIHVGILWCHDVIDGEGYAPDAESLTELAHRDGQYRAAIYAGLAERFKAAAAPWAMGWRLDPWAPYGPEGGLSGGSLLVHVISTYLMGGQ